MNKNEKRFLLLLFFGIFIFFSIWFYDIHPIILFDTDDWYYSYRHRHPIPLWGSWNPVRVFPEVFMPIVSSIGAYIVYPISGDYFGSFTLSYAIFTAGVIVLLFYAMYRRFYDGKNFDNLIFLLYFFFICHFWIFRSENEGNNYMLGSVDACTYFYYVIPNLLNSVAVLWYSIDESLHRINLKTHYKRQAIFVFLTYFCIFSNIWASVILGAYVGAVLTHDLISDLVKRNFKLFDYCKQHSTDFSILTIWGISQVFELSGRRAKSLEGDSIFHCMKETLTYIKQVILAMNIKFLLFVLLILIVGMFLIIRHKKGETVILWMLSTLILALYLILSCSKADPRYICRPDVFYGIFFFGMLMIMHCGKEILDCIPGLQIILLLVFFIITVDCNTSGKTFLESNVKQLEPELCKRIDEDLLNQLLEAKAAGLKEPPLYVPLFEASSKDNWPIATYAYNRIPMQPYKYGALKEKITVTEIIPTYDKNIELHVPK